MSFLNTTYTYSFDQRQKIQCLRDKIENSNVLSVGTEDIFMSKFLFYTNWDVEKAFESIVRYYEFKVGHSEWLAHHTVEYFREEFLSINAKFLMPLPDKMGRPIVIFKSDIRAYKIRVRTEPRYIHQEYAAERVMLAVNLIFTHDGKNFNKLRNMVGYEFLPAEYGGPSTNQLNVDILLNHLLEHSEYLSKLQTYNKK